MANINKNELYNLICEYYEENGKYISALWKNGLSMNDWADALGVNIAPATITALVREGLLVVETIEEYRPRRTVRLYHKPYTSEEQQIHLEEQKRQKKIDDAKHMIEDYENRKRRAYETYEKCVADAEKCLKDTLADYEQWYKEAVAFLEENNEN